MEIGMLENLPEWIAATRAQGDPSLYRHDELEMYIMRIFEKYPFVGGKKTSKRDKRHAFGELWGFKKQGLYHPICESLYYRVRAFQKTSTRNKTVGYFYST